EPRGQARHQLPLARGNGREDRLRRLLGSQVGEQRRPHLASIRSERGILEDPDSLGPELTELLHALRGGLVGQPHGFGLASGLTRDARRFPENLRHDLLLISLTIIFDDAPECARHWLWLPWVVRSL